MSLCPVCQGEIDGSFGMVMCPSCGTAIFFDIAGNPQVAGAETVDNTTEATVYDSVLTESRQASEATVFENQETIVVPRPQVGEFQLEEPAAHFDPTMDADSVFQVEEESSLEGQIPQPLIPPPPPVSSEAVEEMPEETGELFDPNQYLAEQSAVPMAAEQALNEIADFANAEGNDTGLSYNLKISGIDTSEIRAEVLEELRDGRFGWSIEEISALIKKGELYLPRLNPVKTSIIVNRLKSIEVDVTWSQNV